jgi:DNA-binding SARP family transcriptional activator/Tfp pilus assembly protein PilF
MLPKIQIFTFGTLQVVRDKHAVTEGDWHTRQARQLLKILITERPRPVSTDRLIEILWPNSTPSAAATTLRSAINALRNVLEPERPNRAPSRYILTQSPGYAFHLHPDIWLDVEFFEHELNQAHHTHETRHRRQHLSAAVELYKDDYLISDPYADWVQNERERLRERYFNALLELSELQAVGGNYTDAITACRRILARDEVRENAYQSLMRYQAESGDSASALLTYERCRTILAEELGADPSPLTQLLHQRILKGEIVPTSSDGLTYGGHFQDSNGERVHDGALSWQDKAQQGASIPQGAVLPALDEYFIEIFVGRESEKTRLCTALESAIDGEGALMVLEGEAGVGKTRLAYTVLQDAVDQEVTVVSATCQALEQKSPFAALADSIGRYVHALPDAALYSLPHASLSQLAQVIPSIQDRMPDLEAPIVDGAGADEHRQRLIEGFVAFLAGLSELRPLLLFLDDLHWADQDTLAVLSRLAQRVNELPLFMLLAYRSDDLAENEALITLLHAFNRTHQHYLVKVTRLSQHNIHQFVDLFIGETNRNSADLAAFLYDATQGNALFVTEALRDLRERYLTGDQDGLEQMTDLWSSRFRQVLTLRRNQRIQEIVLERVERLPENALTVLQLGSAIGRDFSLDLLESAVTTDPIDSLDTLLQRKFLIERPDERLDFSHQVVRQTVYDNMNNLQRRRLHRRIGDALVELEQAEVNPGEAAFHYGYAGKDAWKALGRYSVLAGEKLLRTFGFRQAVEHFDNALTVLEPVADVDPALIVRALQGRGLAFESLLDPDGVTDTYRRLQSWASRQSDRQLMLTAHSRLTSMLQLVGQQRESNELLGDLFDSLVSNSEEPIRSLAVADLLDRRRLIYSADGPQKNTKWTPFVPPPPVPANPVQDILAILEPVHAVLPLLDYGWTLRVQGQLKEANSCLEKAVELATETGQRSVASIAYFQLAVAARMQGDLERSQLFNEQSIELNRPGENSATELVSMWPRIASAFQSLHAGRLDEAERRLQRVADFLDNSDSFRNHRNSMNIGLGLVALGRGERSVAKEMLQDALSDPVNLYPYTHVQALLGLAQVANLEGDNQGCRALLRQALHFAGQRSLIEEYVEAVLAIARINPPRAPIDRLLQETIMHVQTAGLLAVEAQLRDASEDVTLDNVSDAVL